MRKQQKEQIQNILQPLPMPAFDPGRMEETIMQSRQILQTNQLRKRTSFQTFFITQFRFIGAKVWGMQLLIVLSMVFFVHSFVASSSTDKLQVLAQASIAAPLLFLAGIQVLSRSFTHNMMEIELSTKYSLEKLMMVRLSILGMVDMVCLVLLAMVFSIQLDGQLGLMLLYLFVPFNLTCLGSLWILNRSRSKESSYYCVAYGGILMLVQFILSFQDVGLYEASAIIFWVVILVISSAVIIMELRQTLVNCRTIDRVSFS